MSYSNFQKAMELAKTIEYYNNAGQQTKELLERVQKTFWFEISSQHYEYLYEYGYVMFLGVEFYGIYKDVFEGIYAGNAIVATLQDREDFGLPKKWIPIYDYSDGQMAYLDYSQLNADGEPAIIVGLYNGEKYIIVERVAEDLGDFLLQVVEEQINNKWAAMREANRSNKLGFYEYNLLMEAVPASFATIKSKKPIIIWHTILFHSKVRDILKLQNAVV